MSKQHKATPKTGDEETDAILEEMEQEGEELPAFADAPADEDPEGDEPADEDLDEDEDPDADEDPEGDEEEEEEPDEDEDPEGDEELEDEDPDEEDEEDGADEDPDAEPAGKEPLWKRFKTTKKELKDAQAIIATFTAKTSEAELEKSIDEYATKHKVSKEAAKDLVQLVASLAAKQAGIDPDLKSTIERVVATDKEQQYWKRQDKEYAKDFASNVAPLATRDGKNTAKVKARLQQLAFEPEHAKKSLVAIYLEVYGSKEAGTKRKITSEGNRTHGRVQGKSLEDLQGDDIMEMSDAEFDEMSDSLGKSSKSRIVRH